MPRFLRSRLTCFYCNRGSSQKKVPGLQKFQCEHCDAENYLDENGEITDPPVKTASSARYALSIERPSSPVFNTAPNQIFCNTCLQNQQIYAQSLAEYYPTPNLSTFQEYEQAEAEYKASLEQRYPLICEHCEPLARKRLKDTSYAVKTDNMRRVMERTSPELRHLNEAGLWKLWIPYLGGLMWALSWAGQIAWDLTGTFTMLAGLEVEPPLQQTSLGGLRQVLLDRKMSPNSNYLILLLARYALLLGLFSAWWNPRLKERIRRKEARLVGIGDYYTQQLIILAVRGAALYWRFAKWNAEQEQAAHLLLLLFSLVAIIKSLNTIQIDYTSKVIWRESPKSLLSQPLCQPSSTQDTPTAARRNKRVPHSDPFPIESLATKPLTPLPRPQLDTTTDYTQPSFLHLDDRMDWAPTLPPPRSHTALQPPPPFKPPIPGIGPSPNLSVFSNISPTSIPAISDPKFFPPTTPETGLEGIFDRAFTISHPPAEVREWRAAEAMQRQRDAERELHRGPVRGAIRWRMAMLVLLGSAYALLYSADANGMETIPWVGDWQLINLQQREGFAFGVAALVTLSEMAAPMGERMLLLAVLDTVAMAVFGGLVFAGRQSLGDEGRRGAVGQLALAIMGLGELLLLGRGCVRVTT